MRLTEKYINGVYVGTAYKLKDLMYDEKINKPLQEAALNNLRNSAFNKLGQLEDIENELGIDLILRHKIETSEKLYCRDDKGNLIETRYYYSYGKDGVGLELPMDIEPYYCIKSYPWEDYGKTFALTKEELINER